LMAELRKRSITSKLRKLKTGESVGGIPFTRGPLGYLLRNRFYIGEVSFKGEILKGEQPAIVDRALFEAVQAKLNEQNNSHKATRMRSEALLTGRIFDDRGNRMSPSHARKHGIKYRYYLSSALLDGRPTKAGSTPRVPAVEIETLVVKAVREQLRLNGPSDDAGIVKTHVVRVEVQADRLCIQLAATQKSKRGRPSIGHPLQIPWHKTSSVRRREILLPDGGSLQTLDSRPIRSETRATLVASIARGRAWLDEMTADPKATTETIAKRERCSPRKINKTISLAFLAPELVKAAIEGKLPHGMGVARLFDLPAEWSRQRQVLGLAAQ
jgi:site-specific DNA recombinase